MSYTEREEEIKDIIREYYQGKDFKRLWFTLREVSHAFVNIPVELLKPVLGDKWGYTIGHAVAYVGYIITGALIGETTHLINKFILGYFGITW